MTSEQRRTWLWLRVAGGLSLAWVVISCAFLTPPGAREAPVHALAFDHEVHTETAEMSCADCHESDDGERAGMPALSVCTDCHEEPEEGEELEEHEQEVQDYLAGIRARGDSPWVHYAVDDELIFSHAAHGAVDCAACHGDVASSNATGPWVATSMKACVDCHQEQAPERNTCASCHNQIRKDVPPKDHQGDWAHAHGQDARFGDMDGMLAGSCSSCHTRDTCMTCHRQVPPRSHTNFFRIRSHGLLAANDRMSCASCHKPDMCVRCHQSTVPVSHRGSWAGPSNRHCSSCHLPVETGSSCAVCHQTAPSHALAPARPSGHRFLSLDCRSCHGSTAPLRHPDPGSNCLACHQ